MSLLLPLLLSTGCGGDNGSGPSEPVRVAKPELDSGDGQEGVVSFSLNNPLRVSITRNDRPVADVPVVWSTEDGGELSPSITVSNEAGIAESQWILGPGGGSQTAVASVEGGDGSPVTFTANAIVLQEPSSTTIQVIDNEFVPRNLTVRVGRTVTWIWAEGGNAHNLVPSDGLRPEQSGPPVPGPHTFAYEFNTAGVYTYYCEVHGSPNGTGMAGTITVTEVAD